MARRKRIDVGGEVYHVMNRANLRARILFDEEDYAAIQRNIVTVLHEVPLRVLSYCLMPNHWHFVVWTTEPRQLQRYFKLLTSCHTHAWHARHGTHGTGHVYQGRYKSFIVQQNDRLLQVCAYVERNALAAHLAECAEEWRYGSAYHRAHRTKLGDWLWDEWPVERDRKQWLRCINKEPDQTVVKGIKESTWLGRPYGDDEWCEQKSQGIIWRNRGRPPSVQKLNKIIVPDPII